MNRQEPATYALIVIDMVEDFFDASIWPASMIPQERSRLVNATSELVSICRRASVPVIWCSQEFRPDLEDAFPHMRKRGKAYTISGTPGCRFLSELDVRSSDLKVIKRRFSAFFETRLEAELKRLDVKSLILAGITAEWCVRATAVDAYQRDIAVVLAADCISAFTSVEYSTSMSVMTDLIAEALSNDEIALRLGESVGPGH